MLQQRLRELCGRFQLPAPHSDAQGEVTLLFGGVSVLCVKPFPGGAVLDCVVAFFPTGEDAAAERVRLCRTALRMSLSRTLREWKNPSLPYLAATAEGICLQVRLQGVSGEDASGREMSPLADQACFEEVVEQFLNLAETWQALLKKKGTGPSKEGGMFPWAGLWP